MNSEEDEFRRIEAEALRRAALAREHAMRDARLNAGWGSEQQAEPVAWMFQHDKTGRMNYVSNDGMHTPELFLKANPQYALVCPLFTTPPQQQAEPPPEWPLVKNILDEYGLDAISFVAEWKAAQQQAEPVAYEHHEYRPYGAPGEIRIHAILASQYMMPDGSVAGDFQWLADEYKKDKNTIKLIPLYTAPPQRPWVGLTDEDWEKVANRKNTVLDTFEQGATWAAYKLERRNT